MLYKIDHVICITMTYNFFKSVGFIMIYRRLKFILWRRWIPYKQFFECIDILSFFQNQQDNALYPIFRRVEYKYPDTRMVCYKIKMC